MLRATEDKRLTEGKNSIKPSVSGNQSSELRKGNETTQGKIIFHRIPRIKD